MIQKNALQPYESLTSQPTTHAARPSRLAAQTLMLFFGGGALALSAGVPDLFDTLLGAGTFALCTGGFGFSGGYLFFTGAKNDAQYRVQTAEELSKALNSEQTSQI